MDHNFVNILYFEKHTKNLILNIESTWIHESKFSQAALSTYFHQFNTNIPFLH